MAGPDAGLVPVDNDSDRPRISYLAGLLFVVG
jgi:hypothetical protein